MPKRDSIAPFRWENTDGDFVFQANRLHAIFDVIAEVALLRRESGSEVNAMYNKQSM